MSNEIVLRVGLDCFTKTDILSLMQKFRQENPMFDLTEGDYDGVLALMRESWANFPADLHIDEADPENWLRKEEMGCTIHRYISARDFHSKT